eukprot:m.141202 g.141202  ORF g.141202 m.141202 type:complete len:50 (+) comp37669_c0_seq1:91-240(+)
MRLQALIIVDILALCFAMATLWLMYQGLQDTPIESVDIDDLPMEMEEIL